MSALVMMFLVDDVTEDVAPVAREEEDVAGEVAEADLDVLPGGQVDGIRGEDVLDGVVSFFLSLDDRRPFGRVHDFVV